MVDELQFVAAVEAGESSAKSRAPLAGSETSPQLAVGRKVAFLGEGVVEEAVRAGVEDVG